MLIIYKSNRIAKFKLICVLLGNLRTSLFPLQLIFIVLSSLQDLYNFTKTIMPQWALSIK